METIHKIFRAIYPAKASEDIIREYNLPRTLHLHIRFADGWFAASVPELPGLITQAQSQRELLDMVNDAVLTYFDVPKRQADTVYNQLNFQGMPVIQYEAQLRTT
jgi:predicted RNase H-like HicB family nuclease